MQPRLPGRISPLLWFYVGLVGFSAAGHLVCARLRFDPGLIAPIASAATLLVGCGVCVEIYGRRAASAWPLAVVVFIGASSELTGIASGFPFGAYAYTQVWWPTLALPIGAFPLLVPVAWLLAALCCYLLASALSSGYVRIALAGVLAVLLDLAMEPVLAGHMNYWHWLKPTQLPGGAPAQNYVAWFVLVALAGAVLGRWEHAEQGRRGDWLPPAIVWCSQLVLMLILWIA